MIWDIARSALTEFAGHDVLLGPDRSLPQAPHNSPSLPDWAADQLTALLAEDDD